MTKILCTADNHLGYRQYGLKVREEDIYASFSRVVDLALQHEVDAITVSGDLLHATRPSSTTIAFLKECHQRLLGEGIPVYVIAGNHDNSKPHWVDNLCELGDEHNMGGFKLLDNEAVKVGELTIFGAPFTNKTEWETNIKGQAMDAKTDVLLMHQSFQEFVNFKTDDAFTMENIEGCAQYVIAGDIHVTGSESTEVTLISPGSTEMISSSEEKGKFVVLLDDDNDLLTHQFLELRTRPVYNFDIDSEENVEEALEELRAINHKGPMIFVKCNYELSGVLERIRTLYGDTMIIRAKYYNPEVEKALETHKEVTLEEVLNVFITPEEPAYELAVKLLNPDCDARYEVDAYADSVLNEESNERDL